MSNIVQSIYHFLPFIQPLVPLIVQIAQLWLDHVTHGNFVGNTTKATQEEMAHVHHQYQPKMLQPSASHRNAPLLTACPWHLA